MPNDYMVTSEYYKLFTFSKYWLLSEWMIEHKYVKFYHMETLYL